MSRIGKMPIAVPAGVSMEFKDKVVTIKGPKGTLTREVNGNLDIAVENGSIVLKPLDESAETNARHGLYRALLAGMVKGVTDGFVRGLEVKGVGWKAQAQGNKLILNVGYSHPSKSRLRRDQIRMPLAHRNHGFRHQQGARRPDGGEHQEGQGTRTLSRHTAFATRAEYVEHKEGKTSGKGKK